IGPLSLPASCRVLVVDPATAAARISRKGAYGAPPSSAQRPLRTSQPLLAASIATLEARREEPMPGGPPRNSIPPAPVIARLSIIRMSRRSCLRSTNPLAGGGGGGVG